MKHHYILAFTLIIVVFSSCSTEDILTTFTITYEHKGIECNTTNLNFTFLVTHDSGSRSESFTVAKGERVRGGRFVFSNNDVLNVKVFVASSPDPLHEANIPFHLENYTQEQIDADDNELEIQYCHEEDTANITWTYFI